MTSSEHACTNGQALTALSDKPRELNKERLLELADVIEDGFRPLAFDMSAYINDSNAWRFAGGIEDWAVYHFYGAERCRNLGPNIYRAAKDLLELGTDTAFELFGYYKSTNFLKTITRNQAAEALRTVAAGKPFKWCDS